MHEVYWCILANIAEDGPHGFDDVYDGSPTDGWGSSLFLGDETTF
jgi:hypothetical protein